jgi:hypothetical protein
MNELPKAIFRRWVHSFEEDAGGVAVYRPADYDFPRARGRGAIEFRPDGTFIDFMIGRGDAPLEVRGRWQEEGPGRARVTFDGSARPARVLEIVHCDDKMLKVRQ